MGPLLAAAMFGALVFVVLAIRRASRGQHVWSPGAAMRAEAGDPATVTRHVERPGQDTIRVDVLERRIAEHYGKHALIDPPTVDEGQGDEAAQQQLLPRELLAA